jgi:hypothetical protein
MPATLTTPPARYLLNTRAAAAALGISLRNLWGLTYTRRAIPYVKVGRRTMYRPCDLEAFVDQARVAVNDHA